MLFFVKSKRFLPLLLPLPRPWSCPWYHPADNFEMLDQRQVRNAASEALVQAAKLVAPSDLGGHILTVALELAHRDDSEDLRMNAVR